MDNGKRSQSPGGEGDQDMPKRRRESQSPLGRPKSKPERRATQMRVRGLLNANFFWYPRTAAERHAAEAYQRTREFQRNRDTYIQRHFIDHPPAHISRAPSLNQTNASPSSQTTEAPPVVDPQTAIQSVEKNWSLEEVELRVILSELDKMVESPEFNENYAPKSQDSNPTTRDGHPGSSV
ncbi:hypothetical protein P154DRAFT_583674 [Amniculicola lignicola CBS 123094]|uniref:Uncharacterized protein n=1 Tax=Amniculicola lignicola CBS 123094 TaxID=1392246 RepID=A0A6A5VXQ2_9PLEO|nr:hypothetical protein P154DRAFT_583674 [Amniculicola lignicola CBS 123094]